MAFHLAARLYYFVGLSIAVIILSTSVPTFAGVAVGPVLTNAADAEQHRISVFYEAQKSYQEKLRVGRERYKAMLTNRANVIAGMNSQFAERQQTVNIPSSSGSGAEQPEGYSWTGTLVGVAAIGLALMGFQYYLSRQDSTREDSKYETRRL